MHITILPCELAMLLANDDDDDDDGTIYPLTL